jgi:hypothetical protein
MSNIIDYITFTEELFYSLFKGVKLFFGVILLVLGVSIIIYAPYLVVKGLLLIKNYIGGF